MKKIEVIKRLEKCPIFTFNEFVRMTGRSPEYCGLYLHRLKKEGLVFQIERGRYTVFDDPMLISSHIITPSYLSFWSALRFYNFTEQLPLNMMIASHKPKKAIKFHGTEIHFFKTKHLWGYKKQRYMDFDIFVAEREKCILDCLLLKNTPFEEVAKAIMTKDFDCAKLSKYAVRTKSHSLAKRLGYLMESFGLETGDLKQHMDDNYIPLDWNVEKEGKRNKKWKVIINRRLDDIY